MKQKLGPYHAEDDVRALRSNTNRIYEAAIWPGETMFEHWLKRDAKLNRDFYHYHGGARIASVRAAGDTAVEVATLDRPAFASLMGESELTRQAIDCVADQRVTQNVAAREREVGHA